MIIVSQNRKTIVNLQNIACIYLQDIHMRVSLTNQSDFAIGQFVSEEVAQSVMENLIKDLVSCEYVDIYNNLPIAEVHTDVYFIPEEDGNVGDTVYVH